MKFCVVISLLVSFHSSVICYNQFNDLSVVLLCENTTLCKTPIFEGQTVTFLVKFTPQENATTIASHCNHRLTVVSENEAVAKIVPNVVNITDNVPNNVTFSVFARLLGKTNVFFALDDNVRTVYEVSVVRRQSSLQLYFTLVIAMLITINNINMGCFLNLQVIKKVVKSPVAPVIGFLSQFLFMPLASLLFGKVFFPNNNAWKLGLFVLGCSPGGTGSNFWTLLLGGDVDLSVTMTLFSSIAAMGMMPMWIWLLGNQVISNSRVKIPYLNMIGSLLALTIPVGIGLLIQKYKPNLAEMSKKILRPLTIILLLIAVIGGIFINQFIFRMITWPVVFAGICVAWGGYLFGAIFAAVFGLPRQQVIAVSIETALQNPGVAFVLLQTSLTQPDADLAAIPIVAQLLVTGPPLWILYLLVTSVKKLRNWNENKENKNSEKKSKEEDKFLESFV